MKLISIALLAVILLPVIGSAQTGNRAHDMLMKMDMAGQKAALATVIDGCDKIDRIFFRGLDVNKTAHWTVRCIEGETCVIGIRADADGSTSILREEALKVLGINPWEPLD